MIVELTWLRGTHEGPLRGMPPTGKSFEMPLTSRSSTSRSDELVCERVYFDPGTILEALGIARSPLSLGGKLETVVAHPLTISRSLLRRVTGR